MRVGLQRWYWGQFVEVEHDVEVLGVEVDLHEERGEEHCNIHAIGGREFRGEQGGAPNGLMAKSSRNRSKVRQCL